VGLALFNGPYPLKPHRVSYACVVGAGPGSEQTVLLPDQPPQPDGSYLGIYMLIAELHESKQGGRPPAIPLGLVDRMGGRPPMRGGEYTTLAAPRPHLVTVGGTRARACSSPSPPRREAASGHECPDPASPPSLVPPRPPAILLADEGGAVV